MPLIHVLHLLLVAGLALGASAISRGAERAGSYSPTWTDLADDLPSPRPVPDPDEGDPVEVHILKLKNAKYRRGRPLEDWVQDLDGQRVALKGYMAIGTLEGITEFELVPESCECGKSKVNHFVLVRLTEGVTRFYPGLMTIEGRFEASEVVEDGFVTSVYRLEAPRLPEVAP